MRGAIIVLASGSRGDVEPAARLARHFSDAHHSVVLVTHAAHRHWCAPVLPDARIVWLSSLPAAVWRSR
jgi:UDP:flavonoid glycosyltransferase YjiC (YdhE family)